MGDTTIQQALADYQSVYMAYRNFADRTRVEYRHDLHDFVRHLAGRRIERVQELSLPQIERYLAGLEERGLASLTRRRKAVAIRSFLFFLYQDGYISNNLGTRVALPFAETARPHTLTTPECQRLRRTCAGKLRDAAIVELLLETGLRLSELVHLTRDDVELQDHLVRIVGGRGRTARSIPVPASSGLRLRAYLGTSSRAEGRALFLTRLGQPLGERGVQKIIQRRLREAEIRGASVHTPRHTCAACLVAQRMSLKSI